MELKGYGVLQIEPTDYCNLKCDMCRPHRDMWSEIHGIPKGFLALDVWETIVQNFVDDKVEFDHMIFQWLGDPLLHPQIDELLQIAQANLSQQVQYFRLDSNMILLDEKRTRKIIDSCQENSAPLLLVASIDANSKEVYGKVKGKDALSLVRNNIRRFLRLRKKAGQDCPINLQVQFVVQPGNAHETIDFLKYWSDLLHCQGGDHWHDEIMFKRLSVDGGAKGQAAADHLYVQSVQKKGILTKKIGSVNICTWEDRPWQRDDQNQDSRGPCPGLWYTPVIRHDGSLMMCCADLQGELSLGSLQNSRFLDLWNGKKASFKRRQHIKGQFEGVCQHCGGINWYKLPAKVQEQVEL